jgi:hypothetical protein
MNSINRDEIAAFFERTLQPDIHLVAIVPDGIAQGRYLGADVEKAVAWAIARNEAVQNVYFTVNRVRSGCHKKPTKADIIEVRYAHLDIDPPKDGSPWDPEVSIRQLLQGSVPPTLINWSGNGWQALWRPDGQIAADQVEAINRGLILAFGGDAATANVDRLFRVPGTLNYPTAAKLARGRSVQKSNIKLADDETEVSAKSLLTLYGSQATNMAPRSASVTLGNVTMQTPDTLKLPSGDGLRLLIEQPTGRDRSADTFGFACEGLRRRLTADDIVGVLTNPANAISAHCLDQSDPLRAARRAVENALQEDDVARRQRQRNEDRAIAEGPEGFLDVPVMGPEDMLERFVYIADGGQVADLRNVRTVLAFNDFKNLTAASKTVVELPGRNGSMRTARVPTAKVFLESPKRRNVETLAFDPSGGPIATDPDGRTAFNLWPGIPTVVPPEDWSERVKPFLEHVNWLWGDEADPFLNWLAHLRQRPGELPTYGWLHIAPAQGLGRNWIAGVLARVFAGVTVLGFDLSSALDSGFNGMLGGRILAVVDEVAEGLMGQQHARAQALKRLVTEEVRIINPKFGRMRSERNTVRWLVFSNSPAALPLENDDRRFRVVRCDSRPKVLNYYASLYALRSDAQFISSLSHWLLVRDISTFNPGEQPPMSMAKVELLDRVRPESERILRQTVESWPGDLISSNHIQDHLGDERPNGAALRYAIERAGLLRVAEWQVRLPGGPRRITAYAIRNPQLWKAAGLAACRDELNRVAALVEKSGAAS